MCRFNGRCRCVPIERDAYLDLLFGSQGTAGFVRISPLFSYDALAVVISRFVCVVDTGPASEGFGCHICWRRSGCKRRVGPCVHLCAVTMISRAKKKQQSTASLVGRANVGALLYQSHKRLRTRSFGCANKGSMPIYGRVQLLVVKPVVKLVGRARTVRRISKSQVLGRYAVVGGRPLRFWREYTPIRRMLRR